MTQLQQLLPLLVPLILIQLLLFAVALVDLFREERRVRWFSKPVWALIIFFVNIVGPLAYFFVGREDV
ncbi:MAG TPA: PLD nuclease N-terminal domain-containing protein [Candidatus Limnocylindrales bacterium]